MVEGVEESRGSPRSGLRDPCALRNRQIPVLLERGRGYVLRPNVPYRALRPPDSVRR